MFLLFLWEYKKDHYRIPIRKKCHLNFKRIFSCLVVLGIFIVRNQICRLFLVVKRNIMQSSRETFLFIFLYQMTLITFLPFDKYFTAPYKRGNDKLIPLKLPHHYVIRDDFFCFNFFQYEKYSICIKLALWYQWTISIESLKKSCNN